MALRLGKKESVIGRAKNRRFFDLGLHTSTGTGFLELLTGLMTFLAILALATSFALNAMADRWSSGLDNQVTIEIPASTADNKILNGEEITALTEKITKSLSRDPDIIDISILSREDIQDLVKPWLGDTSEISDIPLPGLITLTLTDSQPSTLNAIRVTLSKVAPTARLDTHEKWIEDLLGFTSALQLAIFLIGSVIGVTTIIAIAAGVRSKLSIHHEEVELLHLMGAYDRYIAKQFQIYAFLLSLKGSITGAVFAAITLFIISILSSDIGVTLLPDFQLTTTHITALSSVPLIIAIMATITARKTVIRSLYKMM